MKDLKFYQEIPFQCLEFLDSLKKKEVCEYKPVNHSITNAGSKLSMGFSCYAAKILIMTGQWDNFSEQDKLKWRDYFYNFQNSIDINYKNYFIDQNLYDYFNKYFSQFSGKFILKNIKNIILRQKTSSINQHIFKTINADNKQAISTMSEMNFQIRDRIDLSLNNHQNISNYLNSYDWGNPWDAGAQFSSIAVYDSIFNLGEGDELLKFIEKKVDILTGSYFDKHPANPRQVINGAMKVITGLDWLNFPIHYPEKLIDYCIGNKPEFEGCDLVDYVYVLYKCSQQTEYKKDKVIEVLKEILDYIRILYFESKKGFSYFQNKSQTHYYGIKISQGKNEPDIHGTMLSVWAIVMILNVLEENKFNYKVIKP